MREFCTKWWKRIATVDMLFIGVLTLLASLFASWLKQFPGFSLFGALIIALLIGMIIQFPIRSAYVGSNDGRKAGVKDAAGLISNKLLRLGIILLGFKLNLAVLFTQGIKCQPIAAVVVTLTIIVCYAIARKLGVDPMLAILTAGGTGICGAAAVMGLAGSIKVPEDKQDEKDNDVTMAVAIVAIMGTVFALLEIALGPLTGMTKDQLGITAGASLHEIAHAVAGGDAFGAVDIATIMKLSRVLMLVFAAIIIAIWWEKKHSEVQSTGKKTVAFPWFMLGFIGASIIGTFVPFVTSITPQLVDFAYIVLGMAMAALGINVNFKAIASKGKKPMLASFLTNRRRRTTVSNWNVSPKNHVLAQRITPAELAGHRNELHHIWTQPGRTRHPADQQRAEREVPDPQQHEQRHGTGEVAGRFECHVAVHHEVVGRRTHHGDAVGDL